MCARVCVCIYVYKNNKVIKRYISIISLCVYISIKVGIFLSGSARKPAISTILKPLKKTHNF